MRRDPQVAAVGLVDQRPVHLRRHVVRLRVEAGLDDVDAQVRDLVDAAAGLVRGPGHHVGTRDVQPRPIERLAARLRVAHPHALDAVVAQRVDGSDAVVGVEPELPEQLVVERQRGVAVVQVRMRVDQPRDDGLAAGVDALGPVRDRHVARRADRPDPAVADEHRGPFERVPAGAVDDARAGQRDRRRRLRERRLGRRPYQNDQSRQCNRRP